MTNDRTFSLPNAGRARPIHEPLTAPRRPPSTRRRRISVTLDHDRYIAFRLFAATHGLSGEDVAVIALDRLLSGD